LERILQKKLGDANFSIPAKRRFFRTSTRRSEVGLKNTKCYDNPTWCLRLDFNKDQKQWKYQFLVNAEKDEWSDLEVSPAYNDMDKTEPNTNHELYTWKVETTGKQSRFWENKIKENDGVSVTYTIKAKPADTIVTRRMDGTTAEGPMDTYFTYDLNNYPTWLSDMMNEYTTVGTFNSDHDETLVKDNLMTLRERLKGTYKIGDDFSTSMIFHFDDKPEDVRPNNREGTVAQFDVVNFGCQPWYATFDEKLGNVTAKLQKMENKKKEMGLTKFDRYQEIRLKSDLDKLTTVKEKSTDSTRQEMYNEAMSSGYQADLDMLESKIKQLTNRRKVIADQLTQPIESRTRVFSEYGKPDEFKLVDGAYEKDVQSSLALSRNQSDGAVPRDDTLPRKFHPLGGATKKTSMKDEEKSEEFDARNKMQGRVLD